MVIAIPNVVNENLSNLIDSYSEASMRKCRNSSDTAYVNGNDCVSYQTKTSMFEPKYLSNADGEILPCP